MKPRRLAWLLPACATALAGCTTVGLPVPGARSRIDFGPRATIRLCVLRDTGVSEATAQQLVGAIDRAMDPYGIDVTAPWIRPWQRSAFFGEDILNGDIRRRPLEPPCDRLFALVGRNAADALWGLVLPETLGAVETTTHTRGFLVAQVASLNQLLSLSFSFPSRVAVHEFYHMLGCGHALSLSGCYRQIARTKSYFEPGADFFPGLTRDLQPIRSRAEIE